MAMALRLNVVSGQECLAGAPASVVVDKRARFVIGRDESTHWRLVDPARQISGKHCEIVFDGTHYTLNDLSTNGTFLNGSAVRVEGKPVIGDGTRIEVGPFCVLVTAVTDLSAVGAPVAPLPPASSGRSAGVEPTAPAPLQHIALRPAMVRSGDPAAMVQAAQIGASSAAQQAPVQVQMQAAPHAAHTPHAGDDPTKIQLVAKSPALAKVPAAVQGKATPSNAAAAEAGQADLLARMAKGLGVPASVLAGQDAGDVAEMLARIVHDTAVHLRQQLDAKSADMRRFKPPLRTGRRRIDTNPLKSTPVPQALALMIGGGATTGESAQAVFARSFDELTRHKQKLDAAAAQAHERLATELAPATFEAALRDAGADSDSPAGRRRLWDMYRHYWHDLAEDWPTGVREALQIYQAEALAADRAHDNPQP
jgi:type VI secretion system FHA domain protein